MNSETPPIIPNQEDKISRFRKETNERVQHLLATGMPTKEIADLLGAEEFLTLEKVGRASPVLRFDVKGFIEREVSRGVYLQLPSNFFKVPETILPPDEGEIMRGSGKGIEKKQIVPRSRALVEVLSEVQEEYFIVEGINLPNMMRRLSYKIFIIPNLGKMIFVNDEGENATFIVHNVSSNQDAWREYAEKTKEELRNIERAKVTTVIYRSDISSWKEKIQSTIITSPTSLAEKKKEQSKKQYQEVPENWITNSALAKLLNKDFKTIKNKAEQYRVSHPEWFQKYFGNRGNLENYYHPDMVKQIVEYFKEIGEKAPYGWITNYALRKLLHKNFSIIKNKAEQYRVSHLEWFQKYLDTTGVRREHYHPDLVQKIKDDLDNKKTIINQKEQEAAKAEILYYLEIGKPDVASEIIKKFQLPVEIVVSSKEALKIIKAKLIELFSDGFPWVAKEYTDHFPIPKEIFLESLKEGLIIALSDGRFEVVREIRNEFSLPDEIIQSKEIKEAIKKGISKMRANGHSEKNFQRILDDFQIK